MTKKKAAPIEPLPPRRDADPAEKTAIARARVERGKRGAHAQVQQRPETEGTVLALGSPHDDEQGNAVHLAETFATRSDDFVSTTLMHLANATAQGGAPSVPGINTSLALIGAIAPRDELEAALAAQIAATHDLSMAMIARTKTAQQAELMRDFGNIATKLQRTMTAQIKALSDWRRGGEQVVRHLHIYEGGQAVVAETVNVGGPQNENLGFKPHEQGAFIAPVPGTYAAGHSLSVSGSPGADPLQAPRRENTRRRRSGG
ncbi:hypothetical protein E0504_10910 [Parafrankia sp. BMG5.11]|nr:hypothetical protein [Parafrankia sp. BMG5.11]TCJ38821.1 hypothetical protein E0504_10910 [Parafrankia sp. BMG5.11]